MSLSVVISTYNRQEKLRDCLQSVRSIADEIIVVNNSSEDDTVKVAKEFTSHIYTRENNRMLNISKNFGFTKATKEWILYLDDDERITPELGEEIVSIINHQSSIINDTAGFWIPRKNIIFGKWIEHTGWYPDYQLRLFKRGAGKFPEVHVHEMVAVEGALAYANNPMLHSNYETIHEFLFKMVMTYAPNEAEVLMKNGYIFDYLDCIRFPAKEFLSRFFARQGYKDGLHGLMLSLLMAFYHLVIFGFIWEKKKFVVIDSEEMLAQISTEAKSFKNDVKYWAHTQKIETTKNPLKKVLHKAARKIGI